jgi:voltage-gated potassium channel
MLVAALLVIPVIALEESNVSGRWDTVAAIMNWLIWLAFATEVVTMLAVVSSRRAWLRAHPLEVLIVLVTPPFLPATLQSLRVVRLLRLFRLLRLASLARRLFSLEGLRYAAILAALTAVAAGEAFAAVESKKTAWDGIWWAITTMTTVGYGDEYPVTVTGRIVGIALMLVGIGFFAILTGAVAERFVAHDMEAGAEAQAAAVEEVEATEAELLAELRAIRVRLDALEGRLSARP